MNEPTAEQLKNREAAAISVSTLTTPETPFVVTTPTDTLIPDTSKLDTTIPQLQAINESLLGKPAYQTEQEKIHGIPELEKAQTDLSSRLKALQNEALAIPLQLQEQFAGRGVTVGGLAPIQAGALRQNAIQSLGVSALLEASRGNITLAQDQVARAVNAKYDPLGAEQKAKLANLDLIVKDPATTLADKNRAIALQTIENKKTADLAFAKKNEEEAKTKALEYASIADPLTLNKMMGAKSALEVAQIARSKGLVTPGEAKAKAELERIKSQTAKDYAEAQKTLKAEIGATNKPLSTNQIVQLKETYGWTPQFGFSASQLSKYMQDNPNATPAELEAGARQAGEQTGATPAKTTTTTPEAIISFVTNNMTPEQKTALKKKAGTAGVSSMWKTASVDIKNYLNSITAQIQEALDSGFTQEEIMDFLTK